MVWMLWIAWVFGAPAEPDSNVMAELELSHSPQQVFEQLVDTKDVAALFPGHCARKWEFENTVVGKGARVRVTYRAALMRRRLTATVTRTDANTRVEWDHEGNRGFVTRWTIREGGDGGSIVELKTWIQPAPWPLRKYYFNRVQPEWQRCYSDVLQNLKRTLDSD